MQGVQKLRAYSFEELVREEVQAYNILHSYADCIGTVATETWCDRDKEIVKHCIEILAEHVKDVEE